MSSPFPPKQKYNQRLPGFYGEFGTGNNAQIFYVQTGLRPSQLERVTLVNRIKGSEAWPVRNLFQREVDTERVTKKILPYFQNPHKVKFFNPLTLTVLPIDKNTGEIQTDLPLLEPTDLELDNHSWRALEYQPYYRFRHIPTDPEYGLVEWNDSDVRICAIDGQHRLSALKRFFDDPQEHTEAQNWTIPVVLFGVRQLKPGPGATLLQAIRSIFIYINKEAKEPNRARQILLSDESICSLAAQELLDYAHRNDLKERELRDESRLPLLMFDWRGAEHQGQREVEPAALKTIEELHDWFEYYVLGEDFSKEQKKALQVTPQDDLQEAFVADRITAILSKKARRVIKDRVLPGMTHFLESFDPYTGYIEGLRRLEEEFCSKSDYARHAFYELRFGENRADKAHQKEIKFHYDKIVHKLIKLKQRVPDLIERDVGMRGIVCAYGKLKPSFERFASRSLSWREYAKDFTNSLNSAYQEHWLDGEDAEKKNLLRHVVYDQSGGIVNYRLHQAEDALGAFVSLLVLSYGITVGAVPQGDETDELTEFFLDRLGTTLRRGYRKEFRPQLKEKFPKGGKPLTEAVNKKADEASEEHIERLEKALRRVAEGTS